MRRYWPYEVIVSQTRKQQMGTLLQGGDRVRKDAWANMEIVGKFAKRRIEVSAKEYKLPGLSV
eukprot:788527-Prorocentrum_lima.AAC.1